MFSSSRRHLLLQATFYNCTSFSFPCSVPRQTPEQLQGSNLKKKINVPVNGEKKTKNLCTLAYVNCHLNSYEHQRNLKGCFRYFLHCIFFFFSQLAKRQWHNLSFGHFVMILSSVRESEIAKKCGQTCTRAYCEASLWRIEFQNFALAVPAAATFPEHFRKRCPIASSALGCCLCSDYQLSIR